MLPVFSRPRNPAGVAVAHRMPTLQRFDRADDLVDLVRLGPTDIAQVTLGGRSEIRN